MFTRYLSSCWAMLAVVLIAGRAGAQMSSLQGRVIARDTAVVAGASVRIGSWVAHTDSAGRFHLDSLPPGTHTVHVAHSRMRPAEYEVVVGRDQALVRDFRVEEAVQQLSPVSVVGAAARPGWLDEIAARRQQGFGTFLEQTDLDRASAAGRRMGELLSSVPGTSVKRQQGKSYLVATRHAGRVISRRPCYLDVYLDGALIWGFEQDEPLDLNTLSVPILAAVEVYSGPAQIPARYNRTAGGCGVMLLWTKR